MDEPHHLTPAHFHAFGYIVSTYAKIEQGLKIMIGGMLETEIYLVSILAEPYSTLQLRNVVSSLNRHFKLEHNGNQRLRDILGEFKTFSRLRNDVGHNMWTTGTREESVKPLRMDIHSGKPKALGISDGERDWTITELDAEAIRLNALHNKLTELLQDLDFASDIAK